MLPMFCDQFCYQDLTPLIQLRIFYGTFLNDVARQSGRFAKFSVAGKLLFKPVFDTAVFYKLCDRRSFSVQHFTDRLHFLDRLFSCNFAFRIFSSHGSLLNIFFFRLPQISIERAYFRAARSVLNTSPQPKR